LFAALLPFLFQMYYFRVHQCGVLGVVSDHYDRFPLAFAKKVFSGDPSCCFVKALEGLVKEKKVCICAGGSDYRRPSLHTAAHIPYGNRKMLSETYFGKIAPYLVFVCAVNKDKRVSDGVEAFAESVLLKDEGYPFGNARNSSRIGGEKTGYNVEQRRFSSARNTHYARDGAFGKFRADVFQNLVFAEAFAYTVKHYHSLSPFKAAVSRSDGKCYQLFKGDAQQNDDHRPRQKVCRHKVDLCFIKAFAYGAAGDGNDLSRRSRLPCKTEGDGYSGDKKGLYLLKVYIQKSFHPFHSEYPCRLLHFYVGAFNALQNVGVPYRQDHKQRNADAKWQRYKGKLQAMKYDYVPNFVVLHMLLFFDGVKSFFEGIGTISTSILKGLKWIIVIGLIIGVLMIVPLTRNYILRLLDFIK